MTNEQCPNCPRCQHIFESLEHVRAILDDSFELGVMVDPVGLFEFLEKRIQQTPKK